MCGLYNVMKYYRVNMDPWCILMEWPLENFTEYYNHYIPDVDVTVRGAISIARRLQDPLAELVKLDPKSIGVGQYQHDVSQLKLGQSLDAVVEDCVERKDVG